ncbi:unnamed protein product [Caenorhabditis bovis]|uniref:Serpentine receptor class gamma n=1 Tax=Caenorhabditis bovis TaxID=2654633 RepID=A0A8S1E8E8_9PELO|nr:unnamed protein product [Caenorhabditis bovis]
MTLSTIFLAFAYVIFLILQLFYLLVSVDDVSKSDRLEIAKVFVTTAQQLSNDIYMMSSPVILLITSRRIRRSVLFLHSEDSEKHTNAAISTFAHPQTAVTAI